MALEAAVEIGTVTLTAPDIAVPAMVCHGCGQDVVRLDEKLADRRRLCDSPERLDLLGVAAFKCRTCEVVLFEDELLRGRFVPPEFRPLDTQR